MPARQGRDRLNLALAPLGLALGLTLASLALPQPARAENRASVDAGLARIENIVVIYAENRSFDHLYGLFPGANGIAQASAQNTVQNDHDGRPLPHLPPVWKDKSGARAHKLPNRPFRIDAPPYDLGLEAKVTDPVHRFYQNQEQINGGKLDRYAAISDGGGLVMGYYDGSQLPLWSLAREFVLADNFFMAAFGGSFLNHFWLICACTPHYAEAPDSLKAKLGADGRLARRPGSPASALDGPPQFADNALSPDGYAVNTMQPPYQPSGVPPAPGGDARYVNPLAQPLPAQTQKTIGDALTAKGVTWAWYAGAWRAAVDDGVQAPTLARRVIYARDDSGPSLQAHHQPFNYFARFAPGTAARAEHLADGADFFAAIAAGRLPAVAFYKPESALNEHPGYADVLSGDRHIAEIVARLRAGPQWAKMAILITYDENGGFWDHAPPPQGEGWSDRWGPGTRVPLIIVSPFARRGFVDKTAYDTTSILKFMTRRFGLEPLPGLRRNAGDLTPAFAFD